MNLASISTEDLLAELAARNDLLDSEGVISSPKGYQLVTKMTPIPCVDGVAVRRNNGKIEAMAIRRGSGPEKGKLCSVGGRIRMYEDMESCLRRQFMTDLNCSIEMLVPWNHPVDALQCAPKEHVGQNPQFGPEYGKHAMTSYYPVRLLSEPKPGGTTAHGGVEALAVEWFSRENFPAPQEFGYSQGSKIFSCLEAAENLI